MLVEEISISTEVRQIVTVDQAVVLRAIPIDRNEAYTIFYVDESKDAEELANDLEFIINGKVEIKLIPSADVNYLLSKFYRSGGDKIGHTNTNVSVKREETFVDDLIYEAKTLGASDIHIEVFESKCRVRFRIDGQLIEKYLFSDDQYPRIVNKLKIKAKLDIAEKRLPQDGRIQFIRGKEQFDIRVSALPTIYGEKIVMRLLHQESIRLQLDKLGMQEKHLVDYRKGLIKKEGIMLISGPTGSGKTTTLYATLKELNNDHLNICTVEDPVEYTLEGINQVQVKESIGLTFGNALKSFLRQDPDIIMLGEIRDAETAQMAIRAALTGHLVLSTIHTNSAIDTIARLIDMEIPPYLISSTLKVSVAQRLLRRLCSRCKEEVPVTNDLIIDWPWLRTCTRLFAAVGCQECHYSGYRGRIAVYEVLGISREIADRIRLNQPVYDVLPEGYKSISDSVMSIVLNGETSIEEACAHL